MNKRRLLKLADLLEADAKNKKGIRFDLYTWAKPMSCDDLVGVMEKKPTEIPVNCNTAACAVGLAAISGAFKRQGLTYTIRKINLSYESGYFLEPKFGRATNMTAAVKFFGISITEANWLFDADSYDDQNRQGARGERYVAKRIRGFVAGKARPD